MNAARMWLLAAALAAAADAQAPPAPTQTLTLAATFSDRSLFKAPERQVERQFPIDGGESVELTFFVNSAAMDFTLIDPGGAQYPLGEASGPVSASYIIEAAEPNDKSGTYQFSLRNPAPGTWKYRARERSGFSGYRAITMLGRSSSSLVAALLGVNRDLPVGREVTIGFALLDASGPVPALDISAMKGAVSTLDGGLTELQWTAGASGARTASFTLPAAGDYSVIVEVNGQRNGQPFRRSVAGLIRARQSCGSLDRAFRTTLIDSGNNGRADQVELTFRVETTRPGRIEVAAP